MTKETVAGIGKAIEEAQRAKDLREKQETAKRETERLRLAAEKQALITRNEARLRATGVVELFEELKNNEVLVLYPGSTAIIGWSDDKTSIDINFDRYTYFGSVKDPDGEGEYSTSWEHNSHLKATISKNGTLQINGHEMRRGERLEIVVKDEILRLKGLKE